MKQLWREVSQNWKKYYIEIVLLTIAAGITLIALILFFYNRQIATSFEVITKEETSRLPSPSPSRTKMLVIDVSGAVLYPDMYEVTAGARLKDAIEKAGGLSAYADRYFFQRNFNLSRYVGDQEKIYVPSYYETSSEIFMEKKRYLEYLSPGKPLEEVASELSTHSQKININSASPKELEDLPGVGKSTVEKIISQRPYAKPQELVEKKILKQSAFEKIKDLIEL